MPGKDYTFGRLIAAQAAGDASVLADHGRPVLRLHLTDLRRPGVAAAARARRLVVSPRQPAARPAGPADCRGSPAPAGW